MNDICDLTSKQCKPCEGGIAPLTQPEIDRLLPQIGGWQQADQTIVKTYAFSNYYQVIAFVNAIAWMTHRENHHPDLMVTFNKCTATYATHAIGGLSENDFICAAKVDALLA
jgi:4a-hydroxytetrahydrobiopterin dehydratase